MTDRTQFEAMLEALINEDQETAKEIFHNIVVAKSREIYEELLESDFNEEPEEEESEMEEASEEDAEDTGAEDDSEGSDDEGGDDVGGDATDDFIDDVDGEEGEEDGAEGGDVEDRVLDLEDALEELKAEFEQLMADEEGEAEHNDGMNDPAFGGDDMGADMGDMGADMGDEQDEVAAFMEYVDKVSLPKHGDNGANTKSIVAKPNNMGGTTANIAKSFSTEKGGTQGGLLKPTTTIQDAGNMNKPGGNAGKTAFKKKESATHGDNGDRGADSLINGVKSRAK